MTATCATITTLQTPPNCSPPAPAVVCFRRSPRPRVILSAGITPAMAAPTTVSTSATSTVAGDRERSNQKGSRPRFVSRNVRAPQAKGDVGSRQADNRRDQSEHERLGKQLPDDPAAARTQGGADDEVALARGGAGKQEQADVAADEHEQHAHEEVDREHEREIRDCRAANICAYGDTRGSRCWCVAGSSTAARRPIVVSSACAVSSVAPGASMPKTEMAGPDRGAWSRQARA